MNNYAVGSDMNFAISATLCNFYYNIIIYVKFRGGHADFKAKHSPLREQNLWFHQLWDVVQVLKRPQNITLPQPCLTGGVLFGL